jgi:hypothetical protein
VTRTDGDLIVCTVFIICIMERRSKVLTGSTRNEYRVFRYPSGSLVCLHSLQFVSGYADGIYPSEHTGLIATETNFPSI